MVACEEDPKPKKETEPATPSEPRFSQIESPSFSGDSAYMFVKRQVSFGPRVPGSRGQKNCAAFLENTFKKYGLTTEVQTAEVTAFNGTKLPIYNIIGRYKTERPERILIFAHWDTRPFADRDEQDRTKPIDGANDGGSGTGVILELARLLSLDSIGPNIGVDFILFDAEDYGKPAGGMPTANTRNTWCLGSQYWANNPTIENYKPRYGVLLDMVGATDAVFPKEGVSMNYAPGVVDEIWALADYLGYGNRFIDVRIGDITDDHLYINAIAKIPSVDIIHYDPNRRDFGPFHHKHDDNLEGIDKNTLGEVGHVMTQLIYREK
jgi:Zn-dependent M28 family amino/carboxypeptidase